ncbi:MAG: ATP-binding protein [Clostridia bacterium]|nr:ATP-binding protein [Clostridia bacterium]
MKSTTEVTLPLSGRIDSNNAQAEEAKLRSGLEGKGSAAVILDAAKLEYISSAGLRILLRLKKDHPDLTIENVSSEVYEILDMTGFTEMMNVEKAYRTISVEGCEEVGRGANGTVYRIDNDNVVKVYNDPEALEDIRNEREMAKLALILGIPTAISYDVVKVGDSYGSVFELLNARSFSKILATEPDRFDWCVKEYSGLLKKLHATVVPEGKLPSIKKTAMKWAEFMRDYLPEADHKKLLDLFGSVPENLHMVHGDYHTKNVMLQNDEVLLIDMDTLSVGDPIFELSAIYNAFVGFHEYDHEGIRAFQGFDFETANRFFYAVLSDYLGTSSKTKQTEVVNKARLISYTRLIRRSIIHGGLGSEKGRAEIALWKGELTELLHNIDELTFSKDELIIPAERKNLDEVLSFIDEHIGLLAPSERARMQLAVAAEEIFVNIADYAYTPFKGDAKVRITASEEERAVTVAFEDGGMPYDPLKRQDPDISLPAEERTPGGLGIFLAKKLTDELSYEYREGKNILKFKKNLS